MKKRVIKVQLNERSIDQAIKELNNYKKWLTDKTKAFLKALADEGVEIASVKFGQAVLRMVRTMLPVLCRTGEQTKWRSWRLAAQRFLLSLVLA